MQTPRLVMPVAAATILVVLSSLLAGQTPALAPPPPMPALLTNYRPVTPAMLEDPSPNDWLQIRRTYDGHAFSPLTQINAGNVGRLRPVWIASTGVANGHRGSANRQRRRHVRGDAW